jgi:hypothetical protein
MVSTDILNETDKKMSGSSYYMVITIRLQTGIRVARLTHENPLTPSASDNMSANKDGKEFPAGK